MLSARKFWRALGFPIVDDADQAFTDQDVAALHAITGLVREGQLDEATALGMTRAVGRSVDRLATWQVQLLAEHIAALAQDEGGQQTNDDAPNRAVAVRTAELFTQIADQIEPLVVYAWRRQAASALARILADTEPDLARAERDQTLGPTTIVRSVGFADLVSFTQLVRRMSERELAALVQRFEAVTSDVVTARGGRVVKTVGDEVLFVASRAGAAALIALDIAEAITQDDLLPAVRVGLSTGLVLARLGDVFGTTVNRASRLTALARPGTVLLDVATVQALSDLPDVELRPLRSRSLRGIGDVVPWVLSRRVG